MKEIWFEHNRLVFVFLWSALFGGFSMFLRALRDVYRADTRVTRRILTRHAVDITTVSFFSGLGGWAFAVVFPSLADAYPEMLAIFAAVMAYNGLTLTQRPLYHLMKMATGIDLSRMKDDDDKTAPEK